MAELTEEEVQILIELYRSQENLFDTSLHSHHDRNAVKESYTWISSEMNKGWTVEQTKSKIKWLRDGYLRNRTKVDNSMKSGCSSDSVYIVRWKWYRKLDTFLRPFCKVLKKGTSNLQKQPVSKNGNDDSQGENSQANNSQGEDNLGEDTQGEDTQADDSQPLFDRIISDDENDESNGDIATLIRRTRLPSTARRVVSQPSTPRREVSQPPRSLSVTNIPALVRSEKTKATTQGPNFAQIERERAKKRQRSGELVESDNITESAVNVLQEVVGQIKTNSEKRARSQTENEKYCVYLATQLDKLSARNQLKARKQIDDIVYELSLKEMENSEASTL